MTEWLRDNPWRQGHVVAHDLARKLSLVGDDDAEKRLAIVVSHDCDIAQSTDSEPELELIVGQVVAQSNGNFTYAKSPRRLHLPITVDGADVFIELFANGKQKVHKRHFADTSPRREAIINPEHHSILQHWLASRYRRSAFPDAFEKLFDQQTRLKDKLVAILKPSGEHIVAVFFQVDDGKDLQHNGPDDAYVLDIFLVSNTTVDPAQSNDVAEAIKRKVVAAFREKLFAKGKGWQYIELRECMVISDQALTYRDAHDLKRWNIDYMSLREDPQQELLEVR